LVVEPVEPQQPDGYTLLARPRRVLTRVRAVAKRWRMLARKLQQIKLGLR
jgi:hypothetical protein